MGLVESIFCEVDHLIIDLVRCLLVNAVFDTARHALRLVSIDEVLALLFHDGCLFLRHRTAHQIGTPQRVACQCLYNLHNLLLVDDTAVRRLQNRL